MDTIQNNNIINTMTCVCGKCFHKSNLTRHLKTSEHKLRVLFPDGFKVLSPDKHIYYVCHKENGSITHDYLQKIRNQTNIMNINILTYRLYKETRKQKGFKIIIEGDGINRVYPEPYYHANTKRWKSYPHRNGERLEIGCFYTKEECIATIKRTFDDI